VCAQSPGLGLLADLAHVRAMEARLGEPVSLQPSPELAAPMSGAMHSGVGRGWIASPDTPDSSQPARHDMCTGASESFCESLISLQEAVSDTSSSMSLGPSVTSAGDNLPTNYLQHGEQVR
jgi:hypothetical protein